MSCCTLHIQRTGSASVLHLLLKCRGELFGSLLKQEVAFFDKEEVGVLTSRLGSDCQAVVRALSTNINVALRNALQAIGDHQHALHVSSHGVQLASIAIVTGNHSLLPWALCTGGIN